MIAAQDHVLRGDLFQPPFERRVNPSLIFRAARFYGLDNLRAIHYNKIEFYESEL